LGCGYYTLEEPIWDTIVHPRARNDFEGDDNYLIQPTALDYASTPFEYWRGDIVFRFEIVCSKFHRGKIAFYYEPNLAQLVIIDAVLDTNKQFVKIVDIQETQEVEFCVKWAFPKAWARQITDLMCVGSMGNISTPSRFWGFANGYIGVTPLTALQSPDDSNIEINVYMRAENMEFNQLVDTYLPSNRQFVPAEKIFVESFETSVDSSTMIDLNPTGASTSKINEIHFGEKPISFRALLKRFFLSDTLDYTGDFTVITHHGQYQGIIFPPLLPSYVAEQNGVPSLLNYLRYAYLCMRGGVRKRWRVITSGFAIDPQSRLNRINVSLDAPNTSIPSTAISYASTSTTSYPTVRGTLMYQPSVNSGIEYELPFYTNNLFVWSNNTVPCNSTDTAMEVSMTNSYTIEWDIPSDPNREAALDLTIYEETSTAEDFGLFRFLSSPPYSIPVPSFLKVKN